MLKIPEARISSDSFYTRDLSMKKFLLDLDCIATRLNRLTDRYFSLAREEEAKGKTLSPRGGATRSTGCTFTPDSY